MDSDGLPYEKRVDKRGKVLSETCIQEEVPFEIPPGWAFARLDEIGDWKAGSTPLRSKPQYHTNGTIPWLLTGDLNDGVITEIPNHITEAALRECSLRLNPVGSILVAMYGATIGRIGVLDIPATTNQACCACILHIQEIQPWLVTWLLFYKQFFNQLAMGGAQPNISRRTIVTRILPLPPLAEQQRIVERVRDLLPLVEEYGCLEDEREALDQLLPDRLRKSILQQAVAGKLVAQDPGDEDASILVERIRKEKQRLIADGKAKFPRGGESIIYTGSDGCHYEKHIDKKGKVLSDTCIQDEIPFEIPNTWTWARLGTCLDVRDGTHDSPKFVDRGFPLVTSKNLRNGSIDFSTCKHISVKDHDTYSMRSSVDNGDILMAMIGSIGNPVLVNTNVIFSCKNVAIFKSILSDLEMSYVHFYLSYAQEAMKKTATGGVQSFVSLRYLRNFLIPIPPLGEQQRIVERVKDLLAIITSQ